MDDLKFVGVQWGMLEQRLKNRPKSTFWRFEFPAKILYSDSKYYYRSILRPEMKCLSPFCLRDAILSMIHPPISLIPRKLHTTTVRSLHSSILELWACRSTPNFQGSKFRKCQMTSKGISAVISGQTHFAKIMSRQRRGGRAAAVSGSYLPCRRRRRRLDGRASSSAEWNF